VDVATVDLWATSGRSYLHRASATAKAIAAALCLAGVIAVQNVLIVLSIYVIAVAATRRAGIPVGKLVAGSAYAGVFAALFAFAQYRGDLIVPLTTIAKAVTAAAIVLLLISTTPYPKLFAVIRRLLPEVIVEVLFMTYRSIFILLRCFSNVMVAVRLRGGLVGRGLWGRARNLSAALALSVLHAFDTSERTYAVMRIRGYTGRLSGERAGGVGRKELPLLAVAAALCALAFFFRYGFRLLNPFSWLPPAFAAATLIIAVIVPVRAVPAGGRDETEHS
jgi:cobalt/nickel transport system permease protein